MPNRQESWSISIEKDYLKFSAAHFLIFPDGTAERLHGHNYKVYVDLHTELDEHGLVLNFQEIKPLVHALCDELDEHLLIPGQHPVLTAELKEQPYEIRYQERYYLIPGDQPGFGDDGLGGRFPAETVEVCADLCDDHPECNAMEWSPIRNSLLTDFCCYYHTDCKFAT